ncbi:EndoU domain-containing protein [Leeuwenhoekiella sp. A16]|uniref:EndoU domain-containing protein n=1 Tax=Leeuwenhoekiella sp. A16 TaxID=3141462 RepID=UPI003A7F88E9
MEFKYFIVPNGISTDKQALKAGEFIIKVPFNFPTTFADGEGPYNSIRGLKKNSTIFKNLISNNPRRAQKILVETNIIKPSEFIFHPKGISFNAETMDVYLHAVNGRVSNSDVTGVHYYDKQKVRIIELIAKNKETGVFSAKIEYFDHRTNKWLRKKLASTFFPITWNRGNVLSECKYAIERIKLPNEGNRKIESETSNGIKVILQIKDGKIKTIYPLL